MVPLRLRLVIAAFCFVLVLPAMAQDQDACEPQLSPVKELPFSTLVYHLLHTRDPHELTARLERIHGVLNFKFPLPFTSRSVLILQERDRVSRVLKHKSSLSFVNKNFDLSHGHAHSINSVDTSDALWKELHFELLGIFNKTKISPIMERHRALLLERGETFNLNDALEEYILRVWSEYCFGDVDVAEYAAMRELLITTLRQVFHGNPWNRLPVIGRLTTLWRRDSHSAQLQEVDARLTRILETAIARRQGVFYQLYEKLAPNHANALEITRDNAFLGVLVYDFIYIVLLDAMTKIASNPGADRKGEVQRAMHDGFLYPFRFRTAEEGFDDVRQGDYCVVNLKRSGLYFSFGARHCPGSNLFKETYTKFLSLLSDREICMVDPTAPVVYNGSRDVPLMTSRHEVRVCPFHRK